MVDKNQGPLFCFEQKTKQKNINTKFLNTKRLTWILFNRSRIWNLGFGTYICLAYPQRGLWSSQGCYSGCLSGKTTKDCHIAGMPSLLRQCSIWQNSGKTLVLSVLPPVLALGVYMGAIILLWIAVAIADWRIKLGLRQSQMSHYP